MYGVDGKKLSFWYKYFLSSYEVWDQRYHASEYVLFKENIGERLSMDETCLSQGELYTILTNKSAHGGKGSLVAMIKGTKSEDIIYYLNHLPRTKRLKVKEITIDLSPSMRLIAKRAFPNATIVSDRFHHFVVKDSPVQIWYKLPDISSGTSSSLKMKKCDTTLSIVPHNCFGLR